MWFLLPERIKETRAFFREYNLSHVKGRPPVMSVADIKPVSVTE